MGPSMSLIRDVYGLEGRDLGNMSADSVVKKESDNCLTNANLPGHYFDQYDFALYFCCQ